MRKPIDVDAILREYNDSRSKLMSTTAIQLANEGEMTKNDQRMVSFLKEIRDSLEKIVEQNIAILDRMHDNYERYDASTNVLLARIADLLSIRPAIETKVVKAKKDVDIDLGEVLPKITDDKNYLTGAVRELLNLHSAHTPNAKLMHELLPSKHWQELDGKHFIRGIHLKEALKASPSFRQE